MGRRNSSKTTSRPITKVTSPTPSNDTTPHCDIDSVDEDPLDIGPKPDDVTPGLWKMFSCIHSHLKINGAAIQTITNTVSSLSLNNEKLTEDVVSLDQRVTLLEAKLERSDVLNKRLQSEVLDLQTRSMKSNIVITFDKSSEYGNEAEGEDCVGKVRHFLANVLGIQSANAYTILVAHRIGMRRPGFRRPIIAKLPVSTELLHVMSQTGRLRNTGHFINIQTPAPIRERHQFAHEEFKEKRQSPDNKARLITGKLYVKGKLQHKFLPPNIIADPDYEPATTTTISSSDPVSDAGSVFTGHAANINTEQDVALVLDQCMEIDGFATSTHRILPLDTRMARTLLKTLILMVMMV